MDYMPIFEETWKRYHPLLTSTDPIDKRAIVSAAKALGINDIRFYDSPIMNRFQGNCRQYVLPTWVVVDVASIIGSTVMPGIFYQAKMPGHQYANAWRLLDRTIPSVNPGCLHIAAYLDAAERMGYKTSFMLGSSGEAAFVIKNILPLSGLMSFNHKQELRIVNRPKNIFNQNVNLGAEIVGITAPSGKPLMEFRNGKLLYVIAQQAIVSTRDNVYDAAIMDTPDGIRRNIVRALGKELILDNASESGRGYAAVQTLKGKDPFKIDMMFGGILRAQPLTVGGNFQWNKP